MQYKIDATTDAIVLAIGSPNRTSDGRIVQCAIAVSDELGLIRFFGDYGGLMSTISIWDKCSVRLERTRKDSRHESFKLHDARNTSKVTCRFEKRHILDAVVLPSGVIDPVDYQNDRGLSIAVVKPNQHEFEFSMENRPIDEPDELFVTSKDIRHRAKMRWKSNSGKQHNQHICSHEVMEGLRKNISSPYRVFDYMQASNPDYEKWLVIGTMVKNRSTWLIVHVHRLKKTTQGFIEQSLWIPDGRQDGWPYLNKEVRRAKNAAYDPQGYLFTMSDI